MLCGEVRKRGKVSSIADFLKMGAFQYTLWQDVRKWRKVGGIAIFGKMAEFLGRDAG